MGRLRLCRSNLAKLPLSAGTGDQMCHLLGGGTSSCAGGKGEAHWAPRQPQTPPLTSSSSTRSLSSRAPPPWLTWLRPSVSPAPRSVHPAQRRRPLSQKRGPGRWRLKGTGAGAAGAGRTPLTRCALPWALAPPLPSPAQPPGCNTPIPCGRPHLQALRLSPLYLTIHLTFRFPCPSVSSSYWHL